MHAHAVFKIFENGHISEVARPKAAAPSRAEGSSSGTLAQENVESEPMHEISQPHELPSVQPRADDDTSDNLSETKSGDISLWSYFARPAGTLNVAASTVLVIAAAIVERTPCRLSLVLIPLKLLTKNSHLCTHLARKQSAKPKLHFWIRSLWPTEPAHELCGVLVSTRSLRLFPLQSCP